MLLEGLFACFSEDIPVFDIFLSWKSTFKYILFLKIPAIEMWSTQKHAPSDLEAKFLQTLAKTRKAWGHDEKFKEVVQKIQRGRSLKRQEFDVVYDYLLQYR